MKNIFCFLVINLLIASSLSAEVAESYKCKLKDGVSRDQIIGLGESYIAVGKKENMDFELSILFPMYSADISNGTFYWNGTSSNLKSLGDAIKIWESQDNIAAINRWVEIVDNCEDSSLFSSHKVN